jgi:hypothetical protein
MISKCEDDKEVTSKCEDGGNGSIPLTRVKGIIAST